MQPMAAQICKQDHVIADVVVRECCRAHINSRQEPDHVVTTRLTVQSERIKPGQAEGFGSARQPDDVRRVGITDNERVGADRSAELFRAAADRAVSASIGRVVRNDKTPRSACVTTGGLNLRPVGVNDRPDQFDCPASTAATAGAAAALATATASTT